MSSFHSKSLFFSPADYVWLGLFPPFCVRRPSVCPPVRLSVRLLDYFSKPISSNSFRWNAFKFYTGIKHKVGNPACAFFNDRVIFGEFLKSLYDI